MKKTALIIIACFLLFNAMGQGRPSMRYEDRIRIREAINISNRVGEKIWKGINKVPFVVLLVTDSVEFLVNHPYPSEDFKLLERDPVLATDIFYRKRQYPDWYLATFPAVNGVNCIVVGTAEKTKKNSTDWIITLLHEHFHQYEFSSAGYYEAVNGLDLSGGDQTGMWQLNYAFPYNSTAVIEQYKKYTASLSTAINNANKKSFKKDFASYETEREKFRKLLPPKDYRYFSLQLWQEGIARYTEYKFLQALKNYKPSPELEKLQDFIPFNKFRDEFYLSQQKDLTASKLEVDKRICFYAVGFAEGILLDKINPTWRDLFLKDKFYVERYSSRYKKNR